MIVILLVYIISIEAKKGSLLKGYDVDKIPDAKWHLPKPLEPFPLPVPFGHIPFDGIDDPYSDYKVPIDPLELHLRYPESPEEQKKWMRVVPKNKLVPIIKEPKEITREQLIEMDNMREEGKGHPEKAKPRTINRPQYFNFQDINQAAVENRNPIFHHPKITREGIMEKSSHTVNDEDAYEKAKQFIINKFELLENVNDDRVNWTTCEEFSKGGIKNQFYPKDVVEIDWEPFFVWTLRETVTSVIHRFSYPTRKIVKEYKDTYGPFLERPVDWEQPKLKLRIDFVDMLIIAGDRNGLFYGITRGPLSKSVKEKKTPIPVVPMRFKFVEPYLAMMRCDDLYATIMASPGTQPISDEEKTEEAKGLKFVGKGYPISRDKEFEAERAVKIEENARDAEASKFLPM